MPLVEEGSELVGFLADSTRNLSGCRFATYSVTVYSCMIKTFAHKGLSEFFRAGSTRKVQPKHAQRLRMILTMLNVAAHPGQMNAPGLRLHRLKGKARERFAVDVDENFRVTFRFDERHAIDVDYGDYH